MVFVGLSSKTSRPAKKYQIQSGVSTNSLDVKSNIRCKKSYKSQHKRSVDPLEILPHEDINGSSVKHMSVEKAKNQTSQWWASGNIIADIPELFPSVFELINKFQLSQTHINKLNAIFDNLDVDQAGLISIQELLEHIKTKRSPFIDEVFKRLGSTNSGNSDGNNSNKNSSSYIRKVSVEDFIIVTVRYCMFSRNEILRFCFECFDTDDSGTINEQEYISILKSVNAAEPAFPGNYNRALELFDADHDGFIGYRDFVSMASKFPIILFPAFDLQQKMQQYTLGESAWLQASKTYATKLSIEEYKASHGGLEPPMSRFQSLVQFFRNLFVPNRVSLPS